MTWEMAFTVVGCFWGVVAWSAIRSAKEKDLLDFRNSTNRDIAKALGDIEWLRQVVRSIQEKK